MRVTTTDGWNTTTDVSAPFSIGGQLSDGLIAFNDWQTGAVWTASIDGGGAKKIVDSGRHPRWSPDGTKLAWDRTDLYTAKPDGSDVRKVTSVPSGQTLLGAAVGDDDTLLAKLENAYPQGNQLVDIADGVGHGLRVDVRVEVRRALRRHDRRRPGPQPRGPLRGLVVDLHDDRRQDRRAARRQVVRRGVARRPLRGRHQVPQRQRLAHRRDRRRPQDGDADEPHQRHVRRLQRLPDLVADRRVDRLGLQQGPQRRDGLRRDRPVADPPRRHRRAEDRRRRGARQQELRAARRPAGPRPGPRPRADARGAAARRRAPAAPYTGTEGAAGRARRPRLQARRRRRGDHRLRVGPRRRRRLRRRRRRPAAGQRSPTTAPTRSPSRSPTPRAASPPTPPR